jgi:hypothetical protein
MSRTANWERIVSPEILRRRYRSARGGRHSEVVTFAANAGVELPVAGDLLSGHGAGRYGQFRVREPNPHDQLRAGAGRVCTMRCAA